MKINYTDATEKTLPPNTASMMHPEIFQHLFSTKIRYTGFFSRKNSIFGNRFLGFDENIFIMAISDVLSKRSKVAWELWVACEVILPGIQDADFLPTDQANEITSKYWACILIPK